MNMFSRISVILSVFLSLGLVACGDDTQVGEPNGGREVIDSPRPETETPDVDEPQAEAYMLEAVSDTQFVVEVRETIDLEVALVKETSREPVEGETVGFTILQAPDTTVDISSRQVETNADGRAKVTLDAGVAAGQVIVRATYPGVEPVEFIVEVSDLAPGNIEVSIFPPSGLQTDLAPYRVRAYPAASVTCQTFPRRADLAGYVKANEVTGTLTTLTDIAAERVYTVTVQAMGTSQAAIAWGCMDDVEVPTRDTIEVSIPLNLVPLNPTGTYEVTGFWDISNAIAASGGAGNIIVGLIDFLSNPGAFIYDLVITELQNAVSFDIMTFLQLAGIPTLVEDTINNWLFQNEDLARFNEIALGIQTMLNELEVQSELIIDKTEADLTFTGREHWQKIVLNLSWRCDQNSAPNCGRYEIPVDADGNLPGLGHVSYDWQGAVVNYDQLELTSLETVLDYGALLVTIINQVVVPELTGGNATDLAGALAYWLDCPGLAQQIAGCASGTCLAGAVVEGACQAAMTTAANQVVQPLQQQSVSLALEFDGNATLFDSAANGFVDQIVDGKNVGTMVDTGAAVNVDWTAELLHP